MQRRTNLFYTEGPDSQFLTFSNYTEYLTGNFLATDYKLFPSTFLCMFLPELDKLTIKENIINNNISEIEQEYLSNIENLDEDNIQQKTNELFKYRKTNFIKNYLVAYYENKLAYLREYFFRKNENWNNKIYPLDYLLNTILQFKKSFLTEEELQNLDRPFNTLKFNYIGDISENDYNGTYTDTICVVDTNKINVGTIKVLDNYEFVSSDSIDLNLDEPNNYLFGWENYDSASFISEYVDVKPQYDQLNGEFDNNESSIYVYNRYNKFDSINVSEDNDTTELKFNIILPLFDLVNINYKNSNELNVNNVYQNDGKLWINNLENTNEIIRHIPLGIWIASDTIVLNKDIDTKFFPSWSLSISSQFKPLPYFNGQMEIDGNTTISNEFTTFAQILSQQNQLYRDFKKILVDFQTIKNQIININMKFQNISSIHYIDELHKEFVDYKNTMNQQYQDFENKVLDIFENLKWKVSI